MAPFFFTGKIVLLPEGRKIEITTPSAYKKALDSYEVNQKIVIEIDKLTFKRSLQQNRYYWLYLGIIEAETGEIAQNLHEYFRRTLLPPKFIKVMDKEIRIPCSTTELNKSDFVLYLDKICSLTGVPLPDIEAAGFVSNSKRYH